MRIGIDAREIVGKTTGVGRYLSGLLTEWAATGAASRHEFLLYTHAPLAPIPPHFDTRVLPGTSGTWWQQVTLPSAARADKLDVFFAPQYTAPVLLNVPTVVVIYDVSFAAHPEWFRTLEGLRLRTLSRIAARRARSVITISEFSRREIAEHLRVAESLIKVIPPGVPMRGPFVETGSGGSRLLYVGSIFNRRHVLDLIRAFAPVARRHPDASLDIVGDNRSYPFEDVVAAIDREQLGSRIRWHQYVTDEHLIGLYSRARGFAFLSEYEGLGLTPLEALAAGVPPVLYDTPIARESCGESALYAPVGDVDAVSTALERILFDELARAAILESARDTLARYDWRRAAEHTLEVITSASRRTSG
jgi:glycosyltransferase involved in cell wall biosynthesis